MKRRQIHIRILHKILGAILGVASCSLVALSYSQPAMADDGDRLLRLDHYVPVKSIRLGY